MARYANSTAKQEGGDDGYCWVVRDKKTGRIIVDGLTRREVAYYRERHEKEIKARKDAQNDRK